MKIRRSSPVRLFTVLACVVATASLALGCAAPAPVASAQASAQPGATAPQVTTAPTGDSAEARAAIEAMMGSGRHAWLSWPEFPHLRPALHELYASESDGLFWFESGRAVATLRGAVESLGAAAAHGLNPDDYDASALAERATRYASTAPSPAELAQFDLAVSISTARRLGALHEGRIDPRVVGFRYDVGARRLDVGRALRQARDQGAEAAAAAAAPDFPVYKRLLAALAHYRDLARAGEAPLVPTLAPAQKRVRPGDTWDGVPALATRLRVLGDLATPVADPAPESTTYAGALVDAVKRFQDRHALEPDGTIGPGTIAAVNTPFTVRVQQIALALERERWLPDTRSQALIFVNVPMFRLWAHDPARPDDPFRMNVVVGKSLGHATPLFAEEMEYVVFSPFWNPPSSIIRGEIVPRARKDPGYLARQNFEIVASGATDAPSLPATPENLDAVLKGGLFVRQRPGPGNSLGLAKFIFPNADNVYMHGTPAQQLFSRARRDFSHGCIRLEDPAALAQWVLRNQPEWTRERIDAAMTSGARVQVNLKPRLTVLIFYDTAYVDSKGVVHFADDYYGHDARLEKALAQGYPYARKD